MKIISPKESVYVYATRTALIVVIALTVLFLLPDRISRAATTFTVNSLADTPDANPGNGICADAGNVCTLRAALQEANAFFGDDTINFSVTGTINLTGALPTISTNMIINGPGSASLTVRRDTGGDYRIFFTDNRIVSISGMTITNGRSPDGANTAQPGGPGGGIRQAGGELTLNDVVITGNRTGNGGTINNNNTAGWGGSGGGIDGSGVLTITNSVISNNIAGNGATGFFGGSGGFGGGLTFSGSTLTMTDVQVTGNRTGDAGVTTSGGLGGNGGEGGGMYISVNSLSRLTRVHIDNNTAGDGDDGGDGGGIVVVSGPVTMTDCTINNNTSGQGGSKFGSQAGIGGGLLNFGLTTMLNCLVSGNATKATLKNSDGGPGAGIFTSNVMSITNSTISNNHADPRGGRGGGIVNGANALTLTNVTITGNSGDASNGFHTGQGLANTNAAIVRNTIIAGNGPAGSPDVTGVFTSQGHNLIGKATAGGNGSNGDQTGFTNGVNGDQVGTPASPIDPVLGPLADNGGPTQTHKLLPGSPAFDAGDNALAKDANNNPLTTDQRGVGRIANSFTPNVVVDIGAFEWHGGLENISNKSTNQNVPLTISFAVGDTDIVKVVTATSGNQTLLPNANLALSGTAGVRSLLMTPALNQFGSTLITVTVSEAGVPVATGTFTLTVNFVNQRPSFTAGGNQTTNEDSGVQSVTNWATNISAGPPTESGQSLTFLVTGNTNPTLFSTGPAISSTGTLTYTAAANASGTATIDVVLKDDGGTANGGQDTSTPASFTITVNPVNDAPSFTKGTDQTINEDAGSQFVSGWATNISTGAPNEFQSLQFIVNNNSNPSLFSSAPFIGSTGSLSYTPAFNASGTATITIVLKDNGGTANGGQDTSPEQSFTITVNAVNDAPVNQFPFSPSTLTDTPLVFSTATFNAISVSDVDAGSDALTVTLTATSGTMSLSGVAGLTFGTGDGTDDATMSFSGTLTSINAALNGSTFKPASGFSGFASLQISTNDQGHNGSGGAKTDTDTISINVRSPGVLQFSSSTYSIDESQSFAIVTITRTGGSGGSTSVTYASSNGTATGGGVCSAGIDYLNSGGILAWADNDSSSKSFAVPICPDSTNEVDETVNLTLSNVTGSAKLGTRTTATLSIINDDPPVLLLEENSDFAIALDSITMKRDPFTLLNEIQFGADNRRRISLFVWRLNLLPTDTAGNVAALAEDDIGTPYPLVVEFVGPVAGLVDVTQVVVKLPDNVIGVPRDLFVKVTLRGPSSNRGRIRIAAP
jgi:CSLREA domain-containing protein